MAEDILDTVISLKPSLALGDHSLDDTSTRGACFNVHFEKARGFYGDDAKKFQATLITRADGSHYWQRDASQQDHIDQVAHLKAQGHTHQHIADQLGISKATVSRHLQTHRKLSKQ